MRKVYEEYIREQKIEHKLELDNEGLMRYMEAYHPRWY